MNNRIEHDMCGSREIPGNAYWGIHTLRARENFPLGGGRTRLELVQAIAMVKKACCRANTDLGYIDKAVATVIETACDEIISGKLADQFDLDCLQGGAGTSTNMNLNEVIANRALELKGCAKGDYGVIHPLNHVNLHQSTNDAYPTGLKIACILAVRALSAAAAQLQGALQNKEKEFSAMLTIGRTEMQGAVPMTLGSQFGSFADAMGRDRWRTFKCEERLRVVNLGGTAIGTGLAAPRSYIFLVIEKLRDCTGLGLSRAENAIDQTANADAFAEVAGMIAAHAATLRKIASDLRLLHFAKDIVLPPVQAGSSIMPGKVNPVICEAAISASIKARHDTALAMELAGMGTLQINEFLPLLGQALLNAIYECAAADTMLARHVDGIVAQPEMCARHVNESTSIVTAFVPAIGYEAAQDLVREFSADGGASFRDFLEKKLGKALVDETLSPQKLMSLGFGTSEFAQDPRPSEVP
jgi:aspartate ammonia-lyase